MMLNTRTKTCILVEEDDKIIDGMMENYPEAGRGNSMTCIDWNYKGCEFDFFDEETRNTTTITRTDLRRGLKLLVEAKMRGELKDIGLDLSDPCNSVDDDADTYDALVQMAVHGKVIYG